MALSLPKSFYNPLEEFFSNALQNKVAFHTFRQSPVLANYIEYDLPELTKNYLAVLQELLKKYRLPSAILEKLDTVGSPTVSLYNRSFTVSQPAIRYWLWALTLVEMKLLPKDGIILEIGGGFGGQAAALKLLVTMGLAHFKEYRLMDLPQACQFQQAYCDRVLAELPKGVEIPHGPQPEVTIIAKPLETEETEETKEPYDLIISNYALSEFSPDIQALYLPLFEQCKHAFLVWNSSQAVPESLKKRLTFDLEECGKYNEHIRVIGW